MGLNAGTKAEIEETSNALAYKGEQKKVARFFFIDFQLNAQSNAVYFPWDPNRFRLSFDFYSIAKEF